MNFVYLPEATRICKDELLLVLEWGTHLYMSLFPSVSVCPSVAHYISGTAHHVIMIFGAHLSNDDITRSFFFHFFLICIFWIIKGVKG